MCKFLLVGFITLTLTLSILSSNPTWLKDGKRDDLLPIHYRFPSYGNRNRRQAVDDECGQTEFKCLNGFCIDKSQVCDFNFNCDDGEDENPALCNEAIGVTIEEALTSPLPPSVDEVQATMDLLNEGHRQIKFDPDRRDLILVVGTTNSGDTTIKNLWEFGNFTILGPVNSNATMDTLSSSSRTAGLPEILADPTTNSTWALFHLPGVKGKFSSPVEIANSYFMKRVTAHARRVKLILLVDYKWVAMAEGVEKLTSFINQTLSFVPNLSPRFLPSVAMVATHVPQSGNSSSQILQGIANFLVKTRMSLGSNNGTMVSSAKRLLNTLVTVKVEGRMREKKYSRLGFLQPGKKGQNDSEDTQNSKSDLRKLIWENIQFVQTSLNNSDFKFPLSHKAFLLSERVAERVEANFGQLIQNLGASISQGFLEKIEGALGGNEKTKGDSSFSSLTLSIASFVHELQILNDMIEKLRKTTSEEEEAASGVDIQDFVREIGRTIQRSKIPTPLNHQFSDLVNHGEILKYFSEVRSPDGLQLKPVSIKSGQWLSPFSDILGVIHTGIHRLSQALNTKFEAALQCLGKRLEDYYAKEVEESAQNYHDLHRDLESASGHLSSLSRRLTSSSLRRLSDYTNTIMETLLALKIPEIPSFLSDWRVNFHGAPKDLDLDLDLDQLAPENKNKDKKLKWVETFHKVATLVKYHENWLKFLIDVQTNVSAVLERHRMIPPANESAPWFSFKDLTLSYALDLSWRPSPFQKSQVINLLNNSLFERPTLTCHSLQDDDDEKSEEILGRAIVSGEFVKISEIVHLIENPTFDASSPCRFINGRLEFSVLQIFALNTIIFDTDLVIKGKNLAIISPSWLVPDSISTTVHIIFDGEPGADHPMPAPLGEKGKVGKPGGNAGHFFGVGKRGTNTGKLWISAKGGDGGRGQKGGQGHPGPRGKSGQLPYLVNCKTLGLRSHCIGPWVKGSLTNHPTATEFLSNFYFREGFEDHESSDSNICQMATYSTEAYRGLRFEVFGQIFGEPGGRGEKGQEGGLGGPPGAGGTMQIFNLNIEKWEDGPALHGFNVDIGQPGPPGDGGVGGVAGQFGRTLVLDLPAFFQQVRDSYEDQVYYENFNHVVNTSRPCCGQMVKSTCGRCGGLYFLNRFQNDDDEEGGTVEGVPNQNRQNCKRWIENDEAAASARRNCCLDGEEGDPGESFQAEPPNSNKPPLPNPAPQNFASVAFQDFKYYLRSQLSDKLRASVLWKFYEKLETSPEFQRMLPIDGRALYQEFVNLDEDTNSKIKTVDSESHRRTVAAAAIPLYNSFLTKLELISIAPGDPPLPPIVNQLKAAVFSKISILSKEGRPGSSFLITNMQMYLENAEKDLATFEKSMDLKARAKTLEKVSKDYGREILVKVTQAQDFIVNVVKPEIASVQARLEDNVKSLVEEIQVLENHAEKNKEKLERAKRTLEAQQKARSCFGAARLVTNFVSTAVNFVAPGLGSAISGVTDSALGVGEHFEVGPAASNIQLPPLYASIKSSMHADYIELTKERQARIQDLSSVLTNIFNQIQGLPEDTQSKEEFETIKIQIQEIRGKIGEMNKTNANPGILNVNLLHATPEAFTAVLDTKTFVETSLTQLQETVQTMLQRGDSRNTRKKRETEIESSETVFESLPGSYPENPPGGSQTGSDAENSWESYESAEEPPPEVAVEQNPGPTPQPESSATTEAPLTTLSPEEIKKKKEERDNKIKQSAAILHGFSGLIKEGLAMHQKHVRDQQQIEILSNSIQKAESDLSAIRQHEKRVEDVMRPVLKNIGEGFHKIQENLHEKSAVALDVGKWKMQSMLRDLKLSLGAQFTRGFQIDEWMRRSIEKLEEAMTALISVYDRIQNMNEQRKLGEFIKNLHLASAGSQSAQLLDPLESDLKLQIEANLILSKWESIRNSVKMWVFPYAQFFLDTPQNHSLQLLSRLNSKHRPTTRELAVEIGGKIRNLRSKVVNYVTTVENIDRKLTRADFHGSIGPHSVPFYTWNNIEFDREIRDLLQGRQVTLLADILKSVPYRDAIKFTTIDLKLRLKETGASLGEEGSIIDPEILNSSVNHTVTQKQLERDLLNFKIRLIHNGNSYYRFNNKIYVLSSAPILFQRTFGTNERTGKATVRGVAQDKLEEGGKAGFGGSLSPYTTWTMQICPVQNPLCDGDPKDFVRLEKYQGKVELMLEGSAASFVDMGLADFASPASHMTMEKEDEINVDDFYQNDESFYIFSGGRQVHSATC